MLDSYKTGQDAVDAGADLLRVSIIDKAIAANTNIFKKFLQLEYGPVGYVEFQLILSALAVVKVRMRDGSGGRIVDTLIGGGAQIKEITGYGLMVPPNHQLNFQLDTAVTINSFILVERNKCIGGIWNLAAFNE